VTSLEDEKAVKWVVGTAKAPSSPPLTEGLTPLDQDRAASVADEGGATAASLESEPIDLNETPPLGWRPPEMK
jgi:hypothetical protein